MRELKVLVFKEGGQQLVKLLAPFGDAPTGFISDGASSPRLFWRVVAPFANLERAVDHDWKCHLARELRSKGFEKEAKALRKEADKKYGNGIKADDNRVAGWLAWAGVRIGSMIGAGWEY